MTTTTAAKFIGQVWSDGCLEAVEFASLLQKRVVRDYEGDIKKAGNTVHIPRLSNLPTQTKSAATDITFTAITEGEQVLTVSTHEYAAFQLESIVQVQSNYDLMSRYQKKIGYALARGREVNLAGLVSGFSQSVGSLNVELTADDYNSAWSLLAQAGLLEASPDPGDEFTIAVSAQAYAALLKVDTFINQDYNPANGGAAISRAKVGDIFGAPVYMSNLLKADGSGHDCAMFHRSHMALAVQHEVPVKSMYMIQALSDAVVGHNIYGYMELSYPPETPGGGSATDNRGIWLKTV
jgi:hypothetical protein